MPDPENPTVALVDPLWHGHHPMFFGQFAASFLRAGAKVIGLVPEPDAALEEIRLAAPDLTGRATCHRLRTGRMSFFNDRFEGDPHHTLQRWRRAAEAVRRAERETGRRVDLVHFLYLDAYLRFLPVARVPGATIGRPWSGLYLRNHHHGDSPRFRTLRLLGKGDALIRSPLCRGVGVLDERFLEAMEAHTRKPVEAFPDVTHTQLPDRSTPLVEDIRRKAAGRKIIGLVGLEHRKGARVMLRVARRAAELRLPWYFVFAGVYRPEEFDAAGRADFEALARDIASGALDNAHFDPGAGRIGTEPEFNDLFHAFDLAWVAYLGFPGSSGALGKAAAFDIPVIATAGECIGSRVETHRLGATIPEGDASAALEAIRGIFERPDDTRDFAGYREIHSTARLDALTKRLLGRL